MPDGQPNEQQNWHVPNGQSKVVFLSSREVIQRTSLSRSTLERWWKNGKFPAPVELSDYRKAWIEDEVVAWQMEAMAARRRST